MNISRTGIQSDGPACRDCRRFNWTSCRIVLHSAHEGEKNRKLNETNVDCWRTYAAEEDERYIASSAAKSTNFSHIRRLRASVSDAYVDFFPSGAGQYFVLLLMKDAKYKPCAELNKKKKKKKIIAI